MTEIIKGNLCLIPNGNTFVCRELTELPRKFAETYTQEEVDLSIKYLLDFMRANIEMRYATSAERDSVTDKERLQKGAEIFDEIVEKIDVTGLNLLQKLLFWHGHWWFYNPTFRSKCTGGKNFRMHHDLSMKLLAKYIFPILPKQIRAQVETMSACNSAIGFGHFAILFSDSENQVRRIVTDTQLIELHDVNGYNYIDINQHGNPIVRCCTSRGGRRAFFDGSRLMAHQSFETCAPKTVVFDAGYKVNSTGVTIINGSLYPLIDADDAVAKTTGAFMGKCDFTNQQHVESFATAEASATRLKVENNKVMLDDRQINPFGFFQPSRVKLLDSGFSLYDWSDYHESFTVQYDHIMVIDDKEEWLTQVRQSFENEVSKLVTICTENGDAALEEILLQKPEVVILDMHLTSEERFEGLYIANKLLENGFSGKILIASSYPDEQLNAMAVLIKGKVQVPGKSIERIRKFLCRQAERN